MSSITVNREPRRQQSAAASEDARHMRALSLDIARHFREPMSRTTTARRFADLAETWKSETRLLSSSHQSAMNRAYQEIIGMGAEALPYILADLSAESNHWFWALAAISGENPVATSAQGNVPAMRDAWLTWGRHRGLLK